MSSSNIPDEVNFSLLIQEIPGTFNRYDREIIHKDMNLTFPAKLAINNWPDEIRWKNFVKFPPRPRGVLIQDLEEIERLRLEKFGEKVDPGERLRSYMDKFKDNYAVIV